VEEQDVSIYNRCDTLRCLEMGFVTVHPPSVTVREEAVSRATSNEQRATSNEQRKLPKHDECLPSSLPLRATSSAHNMDLNWRLMPPFGARTFDSCGIRAMRHTVTLMVGPGSAKLPANAPPAAATRPHPRHVKSPKKHKIQLQSLGRTVRLSLLVSIFTSYT
jgi:hypothetical protein